MEIVRGIGRLTLSQGYVMKELRSNVTSIDQRLVKQSRTGDGQSGLTITCSDRSDTALYKALYIENASLE